MNNHLKKNELVDTIYSNQLPTDILTEEEILKQINVFRLLLNKEYKSILYILLERRYIYYNDLRKLRPNCWEKYLMHLLQLNFITTTKLSNKLKDFIKKKNNLGDYHLNKMIFYSLTGEGQLFFNDKIKKYIYDKVDDMTINFVEEDKQKYLKIQNDILVSKEREKAFEEHKYKLAKSKHVSLLTPEDFMIIQQYENGRKSLFK